MFTDTALFDHSAVELDCMAEDSTVWSREFTWLSLSWQLTVTNFAGCGQVKNRDSLTPGVKTGKYYGA